MDMLSSANWKEELGLLKEEVKSLLRLSNEAFVIVSLSGMVEEVSHPFCELIGKKRTQLLGESILNTVLGSEWRLVKELDEQRSFILNRDSLPGNKRKLTSAHQKNSSDWHIHVKPICYRNQKYSFIMKIEVMNRKNDSDQGKEQKLHVFDDIKGMSESINIVKDTAKRVSTSDATILLRGESGTGKEVFAQAIHNHSLRKNGPFVAINCAAIPESLLESELFGYESGAFTGAHQKGKPGRFELADGGTIFLDEIGDMSLHLQAKLLRIVQEKKIERVGGTKSVPVDVRIIAATHRNLEKLVSENAFREDLFYRLNVIPLTIPPLRERREDIPLLIEWFIKESLYFGHGLPKRLSQEVWDHFYRYNWPGNIRELKNVVEHFMQLEIGDLVTEKSLPSFIVDRMKVDSIMKNTDAQERHKNTEKGTSRSDEKERIIFLLDQYGYDTDGKKEVAKQLEMSLPTLYRRIKKYKIDK